MTDLIVSLRGGALFSDDEAISLD